jgi:DNA end-binding protein Ku
LASDWDPQRYEDTYVDELKARIKAKDKGKDVVEAEPDEDKRADIVDLTEALQRSLDTGRRRKRPSRRRRTSA